MERYSSIEFKNKREIVLLRGRGCAYRGCTFCDYWTDCSDDAQANLAVNREALLRVDGRYGRLEVINSGSVFELDRETRRLILEVCRARGIHTVHFETHYLYRDRLSEIRNEFAGIDVKFKLGLETFDFDFRERVLHKGIPERDPRKIAAGFDEANFLFGLGGQTAETMLTDVRLGLENFERICLNIMTDNTTPVRADRAVVSAFLIDVYPLVKDNERVDILLENRDFGVG